MINRKILVLVAILVLSMIAIFAGPEYSIFVGQDTSNTTFINTSQTHYFNYSLILNYSALGGQVNNISEFSIILPVGFVLGPVEGVLNGVNTSFTTSLNNYTFTNTSTMLNWSNWSAVNGFSGIILNGSRNVSFWFNATTANPGRYNITFNILSGNNTGNGTTDTRYLQVIVNATTNPQIYPANITISSLTHDYNDFQLASGGNYSGKIILNATIFDKIELSPGGLSAYDDVAPFVFTTWFNISRVLSNGSLLTNESIVVKVYNATRVGRGWNVTLNTTDFVDGYYNISVVANSSLNVNNSASIRVTFDNTAPAVSVASSSSTANSLTLTITHTDALSGTYGTCTSSRGNAIISGSTLTESGLTCGTTYTYTVTCLDKALNSGSSTATSFTTASCGGSSSSSSGGATASTANTWTNTESITTTQFTDGVTRQMGQKARVKFTVAGAEHQVGVRTITANKVTIEIASDPVNITLEAGQDAKVDVNKDGTYDVYVKLNSITTSGKADLLVKSISEPVPESASSGVDTSGTIGTDTETTTSDTTSEESSNTTLWIIIAIIVVLIASGIGYAYSKKK